jgi:hypothetical protein
MTTHDVVQLASSLARTLKARGLTPLTALNCREK